MSVSVTCSNLVKCYGEVTIIPDLSLTIHPGEFFTLLGPSGCGKTTLLRAMIGFVSIEGGTISFDDKVINDMPVAKRNIGMVFQNYAIFPHMSTFGNVAFGLKNRKVPKDEIERRVDKILRTVKMEALRDRMPDKMSGGQQQRIALARAIVIEPNLLLMDEPLSNLDAQLRVETRDAIREIQKSTGITTVYVTHDQEEALAISDRIAVMHAGVLQHVGTPKNIYKRPANRFVATFIGRSNILEAVIDRSDGIAVVFQNGFRVKMDNFRTDIELADGVKILVAIRPEEFIMKTSGEGFSGVVQSKVFLGSSTHYLVYTMDNLRLEVMQTADALQDFEEGQEVRLDLMRDKVNVFDEDGMKNLLGGVQNDIA